MYEHFEHTADLGLRVRAADLDALFAEAAEALVIASKMAPDDPRLDGILERACTAARVELIDTLLGEGGSLASMRRHVAPLLLSRDEKLAEEALGPILNTPELPGAGDLLTSVLRMKYAPSHGRSTIASNSVSAITRRSSIGSSPLSCSSITVSTRCEGQSATMRLRARP